MSLITYTAEAYARMMKLLLPPGRIWRLDPDSYLSKLFLACGDELVRVNGRAADLVEEADPRTASELLPEFELMLELPSTGTTAERQARIEARLIRRTRTRPADWQQALAPILGLDPGDIEVIERSRAFAISVGDDRAIYHFFIYRDPSLPGSYNLDDAQDLVDDTCQSHTKGTLIESDNFLCDDPFSLCDRDILGA